MSNTHNQPASRREFFRACGRAVLLGLGVSGIAALSRRRQLAMTGQDCTHAGICSGCNRASTCGLPQALSRRRATGREASE